MAENANSSQTTVTTVDLDVNEILGTPGAENVMIPGGGKQVSKPSIFSTKPVDMTFIDNDDSDDDGAEDDKSKAALTTEEIKDNLDNLNNDDPAKPGRPKLEKDAMIEFAKKLIEKKQLIPFDDDKAIEDYTLKDMEELFEANFQEKERQLKSEIPAKFFDSLPEELQVAAKYVADGGQDLKGMFRSLAQVEEVRQLDPSNESDQEQIVRAYLHTTRFGTSDEIEEEIVAWKDRDELKSKALKFKPKLDAMQEEVIAHQLQQQEGLRKQQHAQAQQYMQNVYKVLDPGEINGLKLDKKTQSMLYAGLVQPNYPSISGRPTNLLGHLLEKYQYVEPRHDLIAEALWLLQDPEGYRTKVKEGGKKEVNEKTARLLKTEESKKIGSSTTSDDDDDSGKKATQKLQRPGKGFFTR